MKADAARKLAEKNKTQVDHVKATEFIKKKIYPRIKKDANGGHYSSFVDVLVDSPEYHKYIIDSLKQQGYNTVVETVYGKTFKKAYKIGWGSK